MNQSMYLAQLNQVLPQAQARGMNVQLSQAPRPHGSWAAPNLHQPVAALGGLHNAISPATGFDARAMFSGNRPASQGHLDAILQGLRGAY